MNTELDDLLNFTPIDPIPSPTSAFTLAPELEIIAQPCCTSRLRYRSEFDSGKNRRGALQSQNNPNYTAPTIRISPAYLDFSQLYFIRVCLVTVAHERNNAHYIHPYELEDIDVPEYNDRINKAIWYPIVPEDVGGIKSFPNLRIVRIKADQLLTEGNLQVLDSDIVGSSAQVSSPKETNREFQLSQAQLAFTIAKKVTENDRTSTNVYTNTTVYSDELVQLMEREPDEPTTSDRRSHRRSTTRQVYKYAPRHGYTGGNEEILIFYDDKLKPEKYGALEVTFVYSGSDQPWLAPATDLEVRDQMLSFKTPMFPQPITEPTPVDIVIKQRKRSFEPLRYFYIPNLQCPSCQAKSTETQIDPIEHNSNKRPRFLLHAEDEDDDRGDQNNPESEEFTSKVTPPSSSSSSSSRSLHSAFFKLICIETINGIDPIIQPIPTN